MLGDNPAKFSYVVGYCTSYPRQPHHKVQSQPELTYAQAAACAAAPAQCNWDTFSDTSTDNPHRLDGGLVGGPKAADDEFQDDRADYIMAEVTLDYNAGFQSVVAGLKAMACGG
jgi:hypothetical protein